jgi:S-adenosylmethionine:diacylglycerol 3-amino-3-carboxypropyl transferase
MSTLQVEAMLSKAGLCKSISRILFQHLNQFIRKGKFESEHKRRTYFAGNKFPPVVDRLILEDKTIIDFWFKEPDKM